MKIQLKSLLLGALLFACLGATILKRTFFSTTSIDSAAFTSLGTNLVAQSTASAARTLLNVTNATGLEALDSNVVQVSNAVNASVTAQGVLSNAAVLLAGAQTISGAKNFTAAQTITNLASRFGGDGNALTNLAAASLTGSLADARLSSNVPLINGTNVFTGTNTFTAANFFPANNIGCRLLWSSPTNIEIPTVAVCATANMTNSGDYAKNTPLISIILPALLGSNSIVAYSGMFVTHNANSSLGYLNTYLGTNTNWISSIANLNTSQNKNVQPLSYVFGNAGSFTQQIQSTSIGGFWYPSNVVDTSSPFQLRYGVATATSHTNASIYGFRIYEIYAP